MKRIIISIEDVDFPERVTDPRFAIKKARQNHDGGAGYHWSYRVVNENGRDGPSDYYVQEATREEYNRLRACRDRLSFPPSEITTRYEILMAIVEDAMREERGPCLT